MLLRISSITSFIVFNSNWYTAHPSIELDHGSCFIEGDRNGCRYFCVDRGLERSLFQIYGKYWSNGFYGGLLRMIDRTPWHWFIRWTTSNTARKLGNQEAMDCSYWVWGYGDLAVTWGLETQNQAPPPQLYRCWKQSLAITAKLQLISKKLGTRLVCQKSWSQPWFLNFHKTDVGISWFGNRKQPNHQ